MEAAGINISSSSEQQLHQRIDLLTKDMPPWLNQHFKKLPQAQAETLADYIEAMQIEFNPTLATRRNLISLLTHFSAFHRHKLFQDLGRHEVLMYLNSLRKSEKDDPKHQWIGTYNTTISNLVKFYRWLSYPGMDAIERRRQPRPAALQNVRKLKRKEESIYSPEDMWLPAEDVVFIKYCPRTDIKCYHVQARDTSARPGELLRPTIEDVVKAFKTAPGGQRYALITVQKKTTQRPLPLTDSIPYTLQWLEEHPFRNVPNAPFYVTSQGKNAGKPLTEATLYNIYRWLKKTYFPRLLKDPNVPEEDKEVIMGMLKKPWNPYIRRHTGLTEKFPVLGALFNQYSGHTMGSKMPNRYVHLFGAQASTALLEAKGILPKDRETTELLKPKICYNCQHPNAVDAKFCANKKCNVPLSQVAIMELTKQKESQEQMIKDLVRKQVEEILASRHGAQPS